MSAIDNLRAAVEAAAGDTAFALDAAFLTAGLADRSVKVPADYDTWISQAFFLKAAADFKVKVAKANVGAVSGSAFTVTSATIPFIGASAPLSATATLVFTVNADALVVQVQTTPSGWTWTSSFAFMGGFPFNQFGTLKNVDFIFSTATGKYPFGDTAGRAVSGGAVQNFSAKVALPDIVKPFLPLFPGLTAPTGDLLLSGALNMGAFNGETVLFPPGQLRAAIQNGTFKLASEFTVSNPSVTLTIPEPDGSTSVDGVLLLADPADPDAGDQAPTLAISSEFSVGNAGSYELNVEITPGEQGSYSVALTTTKDGSPLTPAMVIDVMGGNGGYLAATPDILQQFLAFVGLNGFAITGTLGTSPTVTSVAIDIGSSKDTSWQILPPTSVLDFKITSFSLQWSMSYPFDSKQRQQSYDFSTEFVLAPSVFKGPDGKGDGLFAVQFTSTKQFYASFTGTAKLSDFLSVLSGGAITLDSDAAGDFELGNVALSLDYGAQSFQFNAGFSLALNLLKINDQPVLAVREGTIRVAAKSPTQTANGGNAITSLRSGGRFLPALTAQAASQTQWQAGIGGFLQVGPLYTNVSVSYDGFVSPKRWDLAASLEQPLKVSELINQFFSPGGSYGFPDFLPGNLVISSFAIKATIPADKGTLKTSYDISVGFSWTFTFGDQTVGIDPAKLGVAYDGDPAKQELSGFAQGTWVYSAINLKLTMGYEFKQIKGVSNNILFVEWERFRAEWESSKEQVTFSLKGWSIGTLIQALVRTLGNPYFTLNSPWDLLNQITLDGLRVNVSLKNGLAFSQRLSASYVLSSPINLGFISITALTFRRDTDGKVTLAIEGSSPLVADNPAFKNLLDPQKGQDVQNLPSVPGRGEEWFKVFLLVLGQRVGITGYSEFKNTKEVICALQKVPSTTGKTNPVDPNANQGTTKGLPYYDQSNNWLIAGHLGLLKVAGIWSIDAMLVFNDPNLYGLRLALAGEKMGGLANLVIDILYKKITDDIGVYQIDFTFPDVIRNLNFGAVSITLPQIGIKVYTNGDFFVDIGFPYNLDFRRSFSISVIVYGVPVLGAGGFYIGKLSNATSTKIPKTNLGTFDPVIEFGVGLQLGLGYNFEKGPLKAGFALTVFGIIEGVVAPWHPYDPAKTLAARASSGALQSDYYFKLSGTVGIIGLLYGSVDFAIISASVNVKIVLSIQITYESYRAIPVIANASVTISLKVKINLGLFSISISLSFSAQVSATFIIGETTKAPWEIGNQGVREALFMRPAHARGPDAAMRLARTLKSKPKRLAPATLHRMALTSAADDKPTLTLLAGAQYTVLAPEKATDPAKNEGAFVFLLAMDAPDPGAGAPSGNKTSFDVLSEAYFPWVIDALSNGSGATVELAETLATSVTLVELEAYVARLADTEDPALSIGQLLQFLADGFKLNILNPATAQSTGFTKKLDVGSVLFPVFDGLSLSTPDASGGANPSPIDFETYATATAGYATAVSKLFAQVAADIEAQNKLSRSLAAIADDDAQSMAALVFVDTFTLIARQLLQAGADALKNYAYPLAATTRIETILSDLNAIPGNALTVEDVAQPNVDHALGAALPLTIEELDYVVQSGDTLESIAKRYSDSGTPARWTTRPDRLIVINRTRHVLQGGIPLVLINSKGEQQPCVTRQGDSFDDIAAQLGPISIDALAAQSVLYGVAGLLQPTQPVAIWPIAYTTAGSSGASTDTLASVASLFQTMPVAVATANVAVPGLFSAAAERGLLTIANLEALSIGELWKAIAATGQVGQTAGMVSRFLVYGLRLPVETGLTLSDKFLYPRTQSAYGVYQLTGQQFPTPASATDYKIGFARATESHKVKLDFIELNGAAGTSMEVDLSQAYTALDTVVTWAQTPGNFVPSPGFAALPLAERQPRAFTTGGFARWSSGSVARLIALTDRSGALAADTGGAQVQPTLWALPPAQTNLVAVREQAIRAVMPDLKSTYALLPQFRPQVGRTNPATSRTDYADLTRWAWCTRMDFEIKRLPDATALAAQGSGAGDVPSGPASAPSLPFVYELVGPNSEDAVQLQRILTAMDAMGEGIASAVFLLYNQSGPGAPMLVTPADANFLAFITQTNLSTETNPAAALRALVQTADTPPRGIANSPAQFIRLMWELSTVRSGGYYLYYENAETGEGVPAAVFDSSGSGTMTMVVTFAATGSTSFGVTLPDFVNAFVTTDALDPQSDAVQTVSLASSGKTAPVAAGASLDALSAIYGPGPGRIAEVNAPRQLATGVTIPIVGAVRQLTDADLVRAGGGIDAQATLDKLAKLFSAGAVQAISGQDIANHNPGVTVALAAVFYIPRVDYRVASGAAPGMSFASMAAYYGLDIDFIARSASGAPGIFTANVAIDLDPQLFALRDQLPPQNIGFSLVRDNLGVPPDSPTAPDFAKKTMYQLYTSLAAGLAANVFYKASPLGMPFGPQDHKDDDTSAFESHARSAKTRGSRLLEVASADLDYRQSIGISSAFALVNAAPATSDLDLPPKDGNPYLGVGTTAQIALQWRDIFGNTTVTPFEAPPLGYTGALNGAAVPMLYRDELIGLGSWTNTKASYTYTNKSELALSLALNIAAYAGSDGPEKAAQDLPLYTRIYYQLHQDYSAATIGVPVPGVSGNAVTMRLSNSLLAKPDLVLSDAQAESIRAYVSACVRYLKQRAGSGSPTLPTATLSVPVDVNAIATGNILELDVALTLTRNPLLVDPAVAALQGGTGVATAILPHADSDANVAYTAFSTAFEAVFTTASWYLKVGQGLSRDGEDAAGGTQQLWAVRFGKAAGQGIYYRLGTVPSYYAPKPVAKALTSGAATIVRYDTGESETLHLDGVDLNQWFQAALDAIDRFLSADYAPHAFILDQIDGVTDPLKKGSLGSVLSSKEQLANTISALSLPVLSTSATDASTAFAASEKLRQQLLNQLGAAYRAGAAVVFGLSDVSGGGASNPAGPPSLYGQPTGTVDGAPDNQNFTLTPTRIPLGPVFDPKTKTWEDPRLAFVFVTKNIVEQAYVPLELGLSITHLEFERRTVPGIEGYVDSRWLVFVNGPFTTPLGSGVANIPVVNRNLPTPPTVSRQQAQQLTGEGATDPAALNEWGYSFEYLYQQAASDAVSCSIELNKPAAVAQRRMLSQDGPDLFTSLAQFVANYPAILSDLNQYLVGIDAAKPDPATLAGARKATAAFALETAQIAAAYARANPVNAKLAVAPAHVVVKFQSTLDGTSEGHARTNIFNLTIDGIAASWDSAAKTISNGSITLPAPVIAIEPDVYDAQPLPPGELPAGVQIAYVYTRQVDGQTDYLSEAIARGVSARTVSMAPLDVLLLQSGWASAFVQRNLALFPLADLTRIRTNTEFLFQTPEVRFASPIVPQLSYQAFSLDTMSGATGNLDARLTRFFAGLYREGNGTTSDEVAMQGLYSYEIVAGDPAIPRVRLPVNLLPPTPSVVDPGVKPEFVAPFAKMIDDWRKDSQPTTTGNAQVEIELKVFGAVADAQQPLIQVRELTLGVSSGG